MRHGLIYLASPYSSGGEMSMDEYYEEAVRACEYLINSGLSVWSPIVYCHMISIAYDMPKDFDFWCSYCLPFLRKCDMFLVLAIPGWNKSTGVSKEMDIARELNLQIMYAVPTKDGRYRITSVAPSLSAQASS